MGIVFLMVGLVVFHLLLMNRLLEVIKEPAVSVETGYEAHNFDHNRRD
jgi:hypothetical protein